MGLGGHYHHHYQHEDNDVDDDDDNAPHARTISHERVIRSPGNTFINFDKYIFQLGQMIMEMKFLN